MKTFGKDKDYRKALYKNLNFALSTRKQIKTTLTRAKKIKSAFLKKFGGKIELTKLGERKGDGVEMVLMEWTKKNENKTDTTKRNKKELASS